MVKWALLNRSLVKKSLVHFPEENKTIEVNTEWQNIRYKVELLLRSRGGGLGTLCIIHQVSRRLRFIKSRIDF
jgi:hypothetical protein